MPPPECGHHKPGIPEYLVGLLQALALNTSHKIIHRNIKILQAQGTGVRGADPVFVLMFTRYETLDPGLYNKKRGAIRGIRKNRIKLRHSPVGNKLFLAIDFVTFDLALII